MKSFTPRQIVIIGVGFFVVVGLIFLIVINVREPGAGSEKVTLTVWGVDQRDAFAKIVEAYKQFRSNATVNYVEIAQGSYEKALLEALAAGQGPDIFYVRNRELPAAMARLLPVSPQQLNLVSLRALFPTVVEQDFVADGQIYALPLYLDTLALIYNRDMFDQAGIAEPPKTWDEFLRVVPLLRSVSESGQILRAAAAVGGSSNVDAGVDLVHLLMLQNGVKMVDDTRISATFAEGTAGRGGFGAFNFYLQFANAASPYYTWNESQPLSLDAFSQGKTAAIFNYKSAIDNIKAKAPFLAARAGGMPQPTGAQVDINYPLYHGLAVSKQSRAQFWAWDFVLFATTRAEVSEAYLGAAGKPPALRSLISPRLSDPDFNVFARQALTARSWYEADEDAVKSAFERAIKAVLSGQADSARALIQAQSEVSLLMKNQ